MYAFFKQTVGYAFWGHLVLLYGYGTVLRSQQSMIIHEHDENSWQRLFTVRSLPDAHHPVHGTLGNQDIYDMLELSTSLKLTRKILYKLTDTRNQDIWSWF